MLISELRSILVHTSVLHLSCIPALVEVVRVSKDVFIVPVTDNNVSTLLTGEAALGTWLIMCVALENIHGRREEYF